MRLYKFKKISGKIRLVSGLHVGRSADVIEIGGMDNPIIRNPFDDFPYIPGSSLKGKMRSLLEWKYGRYHKNETDGAYGPCQCGQPGCEICTVFGVAGSDNHSLGPTRVLVRDAFLTEDSKEKLRELRREKGMLFAEEKWENQIDRLKGTARHPRSIERVPAGVEFNFEIALRIFEGDREEEIVGRVVEGLRLITQDALGGMGSRGYGKVEFVDCVDETGAPVEI